MILDIFQILLYYSLAVRYELRVLVVVQKSQNLSPLGGPAPRRPARRLARRPAAADAKARPIEDSPSWIKKQKKNK